VAAQKLSNIALPDFLTDEGFTDKPVNRGVAGRPMSETPALEGASRAHIECDVNVDSLAYWNDPQGTRDREFASPFRVKVRDSFSFEVLTGMNLTNVVS
jgi:hypothetical protein